MGFDAARGDLLTVEDLAFDENRAAAAGLAAGPGCWPRRRARRCWSSMRLCWPACWWCWPSGCVPALRHAAAPRQRRGKGRGQGSCPAAEAAAPRALKPPEPVEVDPERIRAQEIFEQVTEPPEARADAKLAAVAELDSLRLADATERLAAQAGASQEKHGRKGKEGSWPSRERERGSTAPPIGEHDRGAQGGGSAGGRGRGVWPRRFCARCRRWTCSG